MFYAKKLNALYKEIECFMRRNLIRYFLYLNCDNLTRRVRVKKNELS